MRQRGHRLWIAAQPESILWDKARSAGLPVIALSEKTHRFPDSILRLATFFKKESIQVVNTHSSKDAWIAGLAARLAGVGCLVRSRHIEVDYPSPWRSRIAFHHLPQHVLTTSERIRQRLMEELDLLPQRVTCIPTGIDLARFSPGRADHLRSAWQWPEHTIGIGMISVIRSWKGHAFFLQAAAQVAARCPDARFIIAGAGPGEKLLPQKVEDLGLGHRIELLGHREDVPDLLRALDILVLPSTAHEGIPQILLQAQAVGRACIGTRVGGIPEVIEDGVNGLLVRPSDADDLAQAMIRLIENPALRAQMAMNALSRRDACGLDTMCQRVESIYAACLDADR